MLYNRAFPLPMFMLSNKPGVIPALAPYMDLYFKFYDSTGAPFLGEALNEGNTVLGNSGLIELILQIILTINPLLQQIAISAIHNITDLDLAVP